MSQFEHIEAIEKRLWSAADTMRANSNYASNEYFLPVMGLIFLRHAYSRFLMVKDEIEANLPTRGGKSRPLTKEDFSQKSSIFLRPEAQFDFLVALSDSDDRAQAIIMAMESIEADYTSLEGMLPKNEYQELDNVVLGQLLRTLNPEELKQIKGDVFGRIYEYFLTQFADQKAHDGGEFFTPIALVSLIANVLEPEGGIVLDPACGSGGMFVQSARVVERQHQNPTEKLTFLGMEKNATTIRLAKMNLAVHGLEGNIQKAITYYEDPHELLGKAQYVMANPPFNVDEIDADKVKSDPRLPFGLPGINKQKRVSNGNYVWISYFYGYLRETGRAGFVMSSQASSAGRDEAKVRQKLIESGDVDLMVAIRPNFFYTRAVPCELWFLDRAKPEAHKDKVLMIDAQSIYRKVTRRINDFSPEQEQNILAIVWLYREQSERYLHLLKSYCQRVLTEAENCYAAQDGAAPPLSAFMEALTTMLAAMQPFMEAQGENASHPAVLEEYYAARELFNVDAETLRSTLTHETALWKQNDADNASLKAAVERQSSLAILSRDLGKAADALYKTLCRVADTCESIEAPCEKKLWNSRTVNSPRKKADAARQDAVEQLRLIRYFHRQARWLVERFPDAVLCDVPGLVKLVDRDEIENNDWSLTPGRYVGVAPEEVDEDFDFEETLREIHVELEDLNAEAALLAAKIKDNFAGLGI